MAATTLNVSPYTATDAAFRAWGSAVSAGIAAAGWVQTSDTGQINWATVTGPGTVAQNVVAGYEIWRMNDSLQASYPVFLKLQYGSGPNSSGSYGKAPNLTFAVGTASDGAGNLATSMGVAPTAATALNSSPSSGQITTDPGASPSFVNGDGSSLMLLLWPSGSLPGSVYFGGLFLLIERSRNADGSISADGVSVQHARSWNSSGTAASLGFTFKAGSVFALPVGLAMTLNGDTCLDGGNLYPMPLFTGANPRLGAPSKFAMGVAVSDLAARSTISVTMYSETNTWTASGGGPAAYPNQGWGQLDTSGTVKALLVRTS